MAKESTWVLVVKLALLGLSLFVSILVVEGALRAVFNPVNFLRPVLIDDPILGHRIKPESGGHDAWGLRNESIPDRVDIVAIGDSQTYGVSAMAFNSWPAWLSRLTGRSVFNMGLPGWGPIQYEHILRMRALDLNPEIVVLGLYLGNDVFDAYRLVYGLEEWKQRRLPNRDDLNSPYASVEFPSRSSLPVRVRAWIGEKSVLYRLAVSTFGQVLGRLEMRFRDIDPGITVLADEDLHTAFTPLMRLRALDRSRPEVEEGRRLMFESLDRIIDLCHENAIQLVVLVVPTKEAVFEERLRDRPELANADAIDQLIQAEARFREDVQLFTEARGALFVDPRDTMRRDSNSWPIYPSNEGGHPVSEGYRAIAKAVAEAIR